MNQNINIDNQNINNHQLCSSFKCFKCNKCFSKHRIKEHEKKCDGLESNQCPYCKKTFSCLQSKYVHKKNKTCIKHHQPPQQEQHNNFNNHIHDATIQDLTINNNNVVLNMFGKEDLNYLDNDANLFRRLSKCAKKSMYGFSDIVKEIHCNKDRPENNTIIKPLEYGDAVFIMGENNEWEFREFEDVRDMLVDSVNKFVEICENQRIEKNIKLNDRN